MKKAAGRKQAGAVLAAALLGPLGCGREATVPDSAPPCPAGGSRYATRLLSWFSPECSLDQNRYVNPLAWISTALC